MNFEKILFARRPDGPGPGKAGEAGVGDMIAEGGRGRRGDLAFAMTAKKDSGDS